MNTGFLTVNYGETGDFMVVFIGVMTISSGE